MTQAMDQALEAANAMKRHVDVETWIRQEAAMEAGAPADLMKRVEIGFRLVWFSFEPWTAEALDAASELLRDVFDRIPPRHDIRVGPGGNPYYEAYLQADPLPDSAWVVITDVAGTERRPAGELASDESREFARSLLERCFPERRRPGPGG